MMRLYAGIRFPDAAMDGLRPFRDQLLRLSQDCRPHGPDHLALQRLVDAIDTCATGLTGDPSFFHRKPRQGDSC